MLAMQEAFSLQHGLHARVHGHVLQLHRGNRLRDVDLLRGGDETFAFVVEFLSGLVLVDDKGFPNCVRAVRGGL